MDADEEECIGGFLQRLEASGSSGGGTLSGGGGNNVSVVTEYQRSTAYFDGRAPPLAVRKRQRSKLSARPGEQVAAKVTRTDENGSWILAVVQRFYADTDTYDVQDEDDTSKLIRLPWTHVMRLSSGSEGIHKKGT
jgi:SAGA-associated factor 29